jgi:glycosyltransferase involved in cell wall biosynthesis
MTARQANTSTPSAPVPGIPRTRLQSSAPTRVLHVVHRMGHGGIETWLMNVLRNIDPEHLRFDFMVYTEDRCAYDDDIRALGSKILHCAPPADIVSHTRELKRILRTEGPYDVIHVHGYSDIGYTLRTAKWAKIPIRIAHSHNNNEESNRRLRSYVYRAITRHWMLKYMTWGLGCSDVACAYLFGPHWRSDARCRVLYYGLDWEPFRPNGESRANAGADVGAMRASLGIPQDALVIGHVGRFAPQKNHTFWLQVAAHLADRRDNIHFLLVGDGELRSAFEEQVRQCGLQDRFTLTGVRSDVPRVMQAMDVFLFPSYFEGLGIVLLEAQATGLPCVASDSVAPEATVVKRQVSRLSLHASPAIWAAKVLEMSTQDKVSNHHVAWNVINSSQFSLPYCIDRLAELYKAKPADGEHAVGRRTL